MYMERHENLADTAVFYYRYGIIVLCDTIPLFHA